MAIHFNDTWVSSILHAVYFYDQSANTRTVRTGTTPDLFPDDAVAGDCLYFFITTQYAHFTGLELVIPTPLSATSIDGVWEYGRYAGYSGGVYNWNWYELPGLSDGTNKFQNSGTNQITWTCPSDWENRLYPMGTTDGGIAYQFGIRFRITSISGLTEGGTFTRASTRMKPYEIWVESGTSSVPTTFTDIYNADVAGGWGVVTKNQNSFVFNTNLRLGSGYYLKSQDENITFLRNWQTNFQLGVVQIGELYSGNKVHKGSSFIFLLYNRDLNTGRIDSDSPSSYYYNSSFRCIPENGSINAKGFWFTPPAFYGGPVIDCYFEGFRQMTFAVESASSYVGGIKSSGGAIGGGHLEGAGSLVDGLIVFSHNYGIRLSPSSTIVRTVHNCDFSAVTTSPLNPYYYNYDNNAFRCVDCNFGTFTYDKYAYWFQPGTNNKIYITASLVLRILQNDGTPIENAHAVLLDKNGNTVFSFYSNVDGYIGEDFGSGSAFTDSTLSDSSKSSWTLNQWRFREFLITSGSGINQRRFIHYHGSNPTTLNIVPNFQVTPSVNDRYVIIPYVDWLLLEPIIPEYSSTCWSTYTDYNPFQLIISKAGYKSYRAQFDIRNKSNLIVTLEKIKNINISKLSRIQTQ